MKDRFYSLQRLQSIALLIQKLWKNKTVRKVLIKMLIILLQELQYKHT